MRIVGRTRLEDAVSGSAGIDAMHGAFVAWSRGEAVAAPVAHLPFSEPPGDVHIKSGWRRGGDHYVVKIASSFYRNPALGLPSSNGMMLLFDARSGQPRALLQDEGFLTDLRTAAAGALAARLLAPPQVHGIGIVGCGTQARFQLDMLRHVTPCRHAMVWGRDFERAALFTVDGFEIEVAPAIDTLAARCNLIVTTTPSREPLLFSRQVRPGTHITAVGADAPGKQELEPALLARADRLVVDARTQCFAHGETAAAAGVFPELFDRAIELGELLGSPDRWRRGPDDITVCDLTGIALQDLAIAELAWAACVEQDRAGAGA